MIAASMWLSESTGRDGCLKRRTAVLAPEFPEPPAFLIHLISILSKVNAVSDSQASETFARSELCCRTLNFIEKWYHDFECLCTCDSCAVRSTRKGQHMKQGVAGLKIAVDPAVIVDSVPSVRCATSTAQGRLLRRRGGKVCLTIYP